MHSDHGLGAEVVRHAVGPVGRGPCIVADKGDKNIEVFLYLDEPLLDVLIADLVALGQSEQPALVPLVVGDLVLRDALFQKVLRQPVHLQHKQDLRQLRHLEQHLCRRQVGGLGQIRAADAVARIGQDALLHIPVRHVMLPDQAAIFPVELEGVAVVQLLKVEPGFARGLADVEILADEVADEGRVFLRPLDPLFEGRVGLDCPEARIRLFPAGRVRPLAALVELVNKRDPARVVVPVRILVAVDDALGLFVFLVVDVLADGARGGGDKDQRLLAGRDAVGGNVVQGAPALPLVQLVHHGPVDVEAVEGVAVRGQRLENAVVVVAVYLADQAARPFAQRRGLLDHPLCFLPDDLRLVSLGGHGVDLRAGLAVSKLQIQADAGGQQGFSVFLADDEDGFAVLPVSLDVDKTEDGRQQRLFPELQLDELAARFALGVVAVVLKKLEDVVCSSRRVVKLGICVFQLLHHVPVGLLHFQTDSLAARLDRVPILEDGVVGLRVARELHASSRSRTKLAKPSSSCFGAVSGFGRSAVSCLMIFW